MTLKIIGHRASRTMAKIHPHRVKGEIIGYIADLGKQQAGNRLKKFFKTTGEAEAFIRSHQKDPTPTGVLLDRKNEILHALDRCGEWGVSLSDVMEFFALHGAKRTNPLLKVVINDFIETKAEKGRNEKYLISIRKHFDRLLEYVGEDTKIGDITPDVLREFISEEFGHTGAVTQGNLLTNLSVLWNYGIKRDYVGINPILKLDRLDRKYAAPKVLTPEDMTTLLNYCYKKKWYDRLAVFVLVGFCGVRTEEASKMKWSDINLETQVVSVSAEIAKKKAFRNNKIPPNALMWFLAIEDRRRKGPIIGDNFVALLRSAVKYSHIKHTKNCIRHSFASYGIASGRLISEVAADMGHVDEDVLHSHYRNVVSKIAADNWQKIVPTLLAA